MIVHYQGPIISYGADLNEIHSIHDLTDRETTVLRMKEQVLVKVKCVISVPIFLTETRSANLDMLNWSETDFFNFVQEDKN